MKGRITALVWAATAVALTLSLVLFPETALESAKEGMHLFLNVVFPSLLPFFILSEIRLGLGVVHFIGVLFEPLMRPLFNVPGEGAFVLSMGLAAGYPMDAVITARFRRQDMCTRIEGERMLAFSNTADSVLAWLMVKDARAVANSDGRLGYWNTRPRLRRLGPKAIRLTAGLNQTKCPNSLVHCGMIAWSTT